MSTIRTAKRASLRAQANSARRRAAVRAGPSSADGDDTDDEDEWELDDSPGLDEADGDGMPTGRGVDDADDNASGKEQTEMAQRMLAISPPALKPVDPLNLMATEYTSLALGVRWLRFDDVGAVVPVPRGWSVFSGAGRLLGVPLRTHVACWMQGGIRAQPAENADDDDDMDDEVETVGRRHSRTVVVSPGSRSESRRGRSRRTGNDDDEPALVTADSGEEIEEEEVDGDARPKSKVASAASPLLTGRDTGPESHRVGITVTCYRGAFGSSLLSGAHGSPRDVATFFTQLHMMRRQPEGLVRQADFANREDGSTSSTSFSAAAAAARGGHRQTVGDLRSALDAMNPGPGGAAGGGSPFDALLGGGGAGGPPSSTERRPGIMASWQHTLTRADAMPGMFEPQEGGAGSGAAQSVRLRVPSALGPAAVARSAGLRAGPKSADSDADGGQPGSGTTVHAPRTAVLRPTDPIHIYGIEYEIAAAATAEGDGPSSSSAAAGPMRYNLSVILDSAADTVHEVTFASPADVWGALWGGDRSHPDDREAAASTGLAHATGSMLLDAATVTNVPDYEHWAPGSGDGGF